MTCFMFIPKTPLISRKNKSVCKCKIFSSFIDFPEIQLRMRVVGVLSFSQSSNTLSSSQFIVVISSILRQFFSVISSVCFRLRWYAFGFFTIYSSVFSVFSSILLSFSQYLQKSGMIWFHLLFCCSLYQLIWWFEAGRWRQGIRLQL